VVDYASGDWAVLIRVSDLAHIQKGAFVCNKGAEARRRSKS